MFEDCCAEMEKSESLTVHLGEKGTQPLPSNTMGDLYQVSYLLVSYLLVIYLLVIYLLVSYLLVSYLLVSYLLVRFNLLLL